MDEISEKQSSLVLGESNSEPSSLVQGDPSSFYQLSIERLSKASPSDVQQIAASQIGLLGSYNQEVLNQAKKSFFWALVAAGVGLFFFLSALVSVVFPRENRKTEVALVSVIGGALIEVISAINFYLYGKTASQMADFQERLDRTQRFLLANSICEGLEGDAKQKARSELVQVIARIGLDQSDTGKQVEDSSAKTSDKA
ncbi:MAG: hypothetical protein ACFBSF_07835 [Leptolyngbyaceae cyanobacterium]